MEAIQARVIGCLPTPASKSEWFLAGVEKESGIAGSRTTFRAGVMLPRAMAESSSSRRKAAPSSMHQSDAHSKIARGQGSHIPQTSLRDQAEAFVPASSVSPDLFLLDLASKLEDFVDEAGAASRSEALLSLRGEASEATLNCRWPTNKDEAYRFTDLRFLKNASICPVDSAKDSALAVLSSLEFSDTDTNLIVFVDGIFEPSLSKLNDLEEGVVVSSISALPQEVLDGHVGPMLSGAAARSDGDVFACLNGVGARDLGVIFVPDGVKVLKPIQVIYISTQGVQSENPDGPAFWLSSPRLLVMVQKDAELKFVEDFVGAPDAAYWTNSVCEIIIAEGGRVGHNFVQEQNRIAVHIKKTYVSQAEGSSYKLVEACFGGRLSRHNLHVQQFGPDTSTESSSFLLAGRNQVHDLHSKLVLDHPRGFSRQLHKCIVTDSSGHAVFDGNVKVNRFAQKTDAGQLSRSLLLAPRATVNVKPNLQIIADDVKCSHGAAISDLEEEQLFYFRTRGIDPQSARSALVFSFGAEVVKQLESKSLRKRVEVLVKSALSEDGVVETGIPVSL